VRPRAPPARAYDKDGCGRDALRRDGGERDGDKEPVGGGDEAVVGGPRPRVPGQVGVPGREDVVADDDVAVGRVSDRPTRMWLRTSAGLAPACATATFAGIGVRGWLGADAGHHLFDNDGALHACVVRVPVQQQKLAQSTKSRLKRRGESFRAGGILFGTHTPGRCFALTSGSRSPDWHAALQPRQLLAIRDSRGQVILTCRLVEVNESTLIECKGWVHTHFFRKKKMSPHSPRTGATATSAKAGSISQKSVRTMTLISCTTSSGSKSR
jgi:hypothetical protein